METKFKVAKGILGENSTNLPNGTLTIEGQVGSFELHTDNSPLFQALKSINKSGEEIITFSCKLKDSTGRVHSNVGFIQNFPPFADAEGAKRCFKNGKIINGLQLKKTGKALAYVGIRKGSEDVSEE